MTVSRMREMFDRMVIANNAAVAAEFYHPHFQMISNGVTQDFAAFTGSHSTVYQTWINYQVRYDEDAWVESRTASPAGSGSPPPARVKRPPRSK